MNCILLTASDCNICDEDKKKFKEAMKEELKSGEAEITNIEEDDDAMDFWATHNLPTAPIVIMTTDSGKILDYLTVDELIETQKETKEATPVEATAGAETVTAAVGSSGNTTK
jgi:hypothetical protein